ncbi:MAG TPA: hypothetical protein VFC24_03050, partial [Casimicrobiaceae bacterium]|nr:hypothetical protein [Casimicrobiaceae bacterium]
RQDPDHRVWGTADCFVCLDSPPGTVDQGNRYRCTDYTCNECEAPPVSFGTKPIILGACFPPREWVLNHWSPEGSTDGGTYYYDCREVDGGAR